MSGVVADSSFLIALYRVNALELARRVFGEIIIPPAVFREISVAQKPGAEQIASCPWIKLRRLTDVGAAGWPPGVIGAGEAEVMALAAELRSELVLLDDAEARKYAERLGLRPMGTAGFLVVCKKLGHLASVRPVLEDLRREGFWLSEHVIQECLYRAGETGA